MKNTKTMKGITLVALIITIIVLLILAVVAISAVSGDGILEYAKEASLKTQIAQEEEEIRLAVQESYMSNSGKIDYSQIATILGEGYQIENGMCTTPSGSKFKIEANGSMSKFEELKVNAENSLFNYWYDDETNTASISGFNRNRVNGTYDYWGSVSSYSNLKDENGNVLTKVDIPASVVYNGKEYTVTEIGSLDFYNFEDSNVVEVNIPTTVTKFGYGCFNNFTKLSKVNILATNIEKWSNYSFAQTPWLTNQFETNSGFLIVNNNLLQIESTTLTTLTIPDSVKSIAMGVFDNLTSIEEITLPITPININQGVFFNCNNLRTINNFPQHIEQDAEKFIACFFDAQWLQSSAANSSPWFINKCTTSNGLYIYKDILFSATVGGEDVTIPNGIRKIKYGTIFSCGHILTLEIPSSVEVIEEGAFYNTFRQGIEKIKINKTLNSIPGAPWGAVKSLEESSSEPIIEWLEN